MLFCFYETATVEISFIPTVAAAFNHSSNHCVGWWKAHSTRQRIRACTQPAQQTSVKHPRSVWGHTVRVSDRIDPIAVEWRGDSETQLLSGYHLRSISIGEPTPIAGGHPKRDTMRRW